MAGDEHNRQETLRRRERPLQLETGHAGQVHVQHQTGGTLVAVMPEELIGRVERACAVADRLHQTRQTLAHRGVVIH